MFLTHTEFFLLTVDDLRNRINKNTEYDLLRACGLCRQLVIDKPTLFNLANQKINLPNGFEVAYNPTFQNLDVKDKNSRPKTMWITINPKHSDITKVVDLKTFRKIRLLTYHQFEYTVEDIIKMAAVFMGGVHSNEPHRKNIRYRALIHLYSSIKDEANLPLYAIRAVCNVVLNGMEPLELALKGHIPADGI